MATSYNQYNTNNGDITQNQNVNKGFFNRLLRNVTDYGRYYKDMVFTNSYAIGANEDPRPEAAQNMYDLFTRKVVSKFLDTKMLSILDRAYEDKRKILRQYAIKDEIRTYITKIADEMVTFDDENFFCKAKDLPAEYDEVIRKRWHENFRKVYRALGFSDGITAHNYAKNFLIDGYIAYEIVYDSRQKNVDELRVLDPNTLIFSADPVTKTAIWVQYPNNPQLRRILLDSQVIYISYSNNNDYSESSYVEGLIRPYNQLKLLEYTILLFNINHAAIYKKFLIPVNGLTRQQAEQQIKQLMSEYHEEVQFDEKMGQILINGSPTVPHTKDIWIPVGDGGTPDITIQSPQGINLNDDTTLKWFYTALKRATKIPLTRFEAEGGGGSAYSNGAELTYDEMEFGLFVRRLRTVYKEIIVKPLKIQMILDFPELQDDYMFHSSVEIEFNTNKEFENAKKLKNLESKSSIAASLNSNLLGADGQPYLHIEFTMREIMGFTEEQLEANRKWKMLAQEAAQPGAQGSAVPQGGGGGGGSDMGAQPEGGGGGGQAQMPPAQGQGGEVPPPQGQGGGGTQAQTPPAQEAPPQTEF